MMKAEDLRAESVEELDHKVETLQSEVFHLRSEKLDSKSQKTHLIREKRKEIARILTIVREKELKG